LKITFVSPVPDLSGGVRVIAIHAAALHRRGHDVTIVAPARPAPSRRERIKSVLRGQWRPDPVEASHYDDTPAELRLITHGGPITAEDVPDADVVIATWWETAFMVVHFPASKGRKFYFVQHHEVNRNLPRHLSGGSYFLPLRKIAVASWIVDTMRELYGDDDVALVPNSVDTESFSAPLRGRQPRPTVGLIYYPTHFKGLDTSLEAIEIARRRHPDLQVVAFGTVPPTPDLPLPEGSTFHLLPAQDRIPRIYASCDVWIVGSRQEGFGLPTLEAMACRTPVVATRTGAAPDWIEDGRNGFLADVEDAPALGARVADVLALDDAAWLAMSQAALDSTRRYTWAEATELFERAIEGSAGREITPKYT
jgi:glycosyltransferase involved in cell wall biosynthesis